MIALPYPPIQSELSELKNDNLVYAIRAYPLIGFGVLVSRDAGDVFIKMCDFDGKPLDPAAATESHGELIMAVLKLCMLAKIKRSQWYFAGEEKILVDIRKEMDSFVGPGMLRDLCGSVLKTQDVIEIGAFGAIREKLKQDVIIKPAKFRSVVRDGAFIPAYVRISHDHSDGRAAEMRKDDCS